MNVGLDVRWKQRLSNWESAHDTFRLTVQRLREQPDDTVIQMATIKVFEINYDLAWKTLKDFLSNRGLIFKPSPVDTIKEAYSSEYLENGHLWFEIIKDRNTTTHEYSETQATEIVERIQSLYFKEFDNLLNMLKAFEEE